MSDESLTYENGSNEYEFHEYANLFPLIDGEDFNLLVSDIENNGVREPIWLYEGKILDGRNRYRAAQELGACFYAREYLGENPLAFVWSINGARRHLTPSQKATIAVDMLPLLEKEAKARQALQAKINQPQSQNVEIIPPSEIGKSRDKAAAITGANPKYVSDAKKIKEENPELYSEIKSGEKTVPQAKREIKEEKREESREKNRERIKHSDAPEAITGCYSTIVIDPPWDWGDEGDNDQLGRARPTYGTMSFDELKALPVSDYADENCHIYLWITNRSLPKGFDLIESWGFRYITCITWVKPNFGMGNYFRGQTEQILFGVRGSQMLKRKDAGTVLIAPRGSNGHSSKPEEMYDFVESCSHGPYLEMFARSSRDDWTSWGAES